MNYAWKWMSKAFLTVIKSNPQTLTRSNLNTYFFLADHLREGMGSSLGPHFVQ